MADNSIASGTN